MNIAWQVNKDSSFINMIEWEYETDLNYCRKRQGGTVHKYLKHPVGTSRTYFPTWEEANDEVIRQADAELKKIIESIDVRKKHIEHLKKRTKKESYEL